MTFADAVGILRGHDEFILTSHEFSDADGIGAEYALARILGSLGKRVRVVNNEPVADKFAFMDPRGIVERLDAPAGAPLDPTRAVVVVLDTNDAHFTGRADEELIRKAARVLMIDHHEATRPDHADCLLDSTASSTCEIVWRLALELGADIEPDAADALFAGIVYDTGSFIYAKTSASTFEAALGLVRLGVRPHVIHRLMYESSSIGVLLLRKAVSATLELDSNDRVAFQRMTEAELAAAPGASYEDGEDLVNMPLQGRDVEVSVLWKRHPEGTLRCSLRSKGKVNVARVAQGFGGGGHKTAAGFKCPLPLEQMRGKVLQTIIAQLD